MAKTEKNPVDGYTREAYQAGIDKIEAVELHPLAEELSQHRNWRSEYGSSPYPLVEEEHAALEIVESETGVPNANVEVIRSELKRLHGNARREAVQIDEQIDRRHIHDELTPEIEQMKATIETTLDQIGNPPWAESMHEDFVKKAEDAVWEIDEMPRSKLRKVAPALIEGLREFFQYFTKSMSRSVDPNKFGKDKD